MKTSRSGSLKGRPFSKNPFTTLKTVVFTLKPRRRRENDEEIDPDGPW
jgi:hypothetical protein